MVAQSTEATTRTKLTLRDVNVEVDVGANVGLRSRVVFPPVRRLLEHASQVEPRIAPADNDDTVSASMDADLGRLLERYDEFQGSKTFLQRASSLALLCGRPEQAQELAAQAIELDAQDTSPRYRRAEALLALGELDGAYREFGDLGHAGHLESCLRMVEVAIRKGDLDDAQVWLGRAEAIDTLDWRVQVSAGTIALIAGAFGRAIHHLRNSLEDRPRAVRVHYELALAQMLAGNTKNAAKSLRRAVALDPFEERVLLTWTDLSLHLHQGLPEVGNALSKYLAFEPSNSSVTHRFADVLYEQGLNREAQQILMQMQRIGDDPRIGNNLGVIAASRHDFRRAIAEFTKSVNMIAQSDVADSHLRGVATANLVNALIKAEASKTTVQVAQEFVDSTPLSEVLSRDPSYQIADGLIHGLMELGRFTEAVGYAEAWVGAAEIHPRLEIGLLEKLVCYFTLESEAYRKAYEYALRAYEAQGALTPRDVGLKYMALNNLAVAAIELAKYEDASEYLSRMQPAPGVPMACGYATRGLLALRTGDVAKGESLYRRAIGVANPALKTQLRKKLDWEMGVYWESRGSWKRARGFYRNVGRAKVDGMWKMAYLDDKARSRLRQGRSGKGAKKGGSSRR
ncbi:MAG: tetratricopeptide repeat protein [Gammaproteobacteria bacterium]|nr:tetratricopeptide repeat protein [Gammaproteobacteria bacterium]